MLKVSKKFAKEMQKYKKEDGEDQYNRVWMSITDFTDFQFAMQEYLMGTFPRNPWNCAKVDEETIPILENLRKINVLGFVTISSQPGICSDENGYSEIQRAFIEGFMKRDMVKSFVKKLAEYDILVVVYGTLTEDNEQNFTSAYLYGKRYGTVNSILNKLRRVPTEYILVKNRRISLTQETRYYTNEPLRGFRNEGNADEISKEFSRKLAVETVILSVILLKACRTDLIDTVLRVLKTINRRKLIRTEKMLINVREE
jgi:hypothetical protein